MRFERNVVIPLALPEARRLLDELERRIPAVPGLAVSVELTVVDRRSTSVRLVGDWQGGMGPSSAIVVGTGMRLFRRYGDQVLAMARERAKEAAKRAASGRSSGNGNAKGNAKGSTAPPPRKATAPDATGEAPGGPSPWPPLLRRPSTWVAAVVGVAVLARAARRGQRRT